MTIAPSTPSWRWRPGTDAGPLSEREVLRHAGGCLPSAEIATRMNLSQGTVRNDLSECIGKLGVSNRIEVGRLARQKGWL